MKKIIYSLVAMLFMGGIITSCIEPFEPEGIEDIRHAQAEYIRSLTKVKEADAEVQKAEAQFILAKAAVKQAIAAQEQAKADYQVLINELKAAQNEQAIAALQAQMEQDALKHQATMAGLQAQLAEAQKNLADVLRALEIDGLRLSQEEQASINYIKGMYDYYASELQKMYADLADDLMKFDEDGNLVGGEYYEYYNYLYDGIIDAAEQPYLDAFLAEKIAVKEQELANAEKAAEFWKDLTDDFVFDYLAQADTYRDSAQALASEFADLLRDSTIYANTNLPILEKAIADAEKAFEEATKDPKAAFDAAVKAIGKKDIALIDQVPADKLNDTAANAQMAKAKDVPYEFSKKFVLPKSANEYDLVPVYERYLDERWYNYAKQVEFIPGKPGEPDTLSINIKPVKKEADYLAIADSVWAGAQETVEDIEPDGIGVTNLVSTGLWSAYEDFGREYLYDLTIAGLEKEADALLAYKDSVQALYDSLYNKVLKAAKPNQADILLKAWYDKVAATKKSINDLKAAVLADINYDGDAENDVYSYTDNDTYHDVWTSSFDGPIALYKKGGTWWEMPRKVSVDASDNTKFTLDYNSNEFFTGASGVLNLTMTISPTKADSVKVFNDIVGFFKAVAAVDEDAVPFLKFIVATNSGKTFEVQKLRADKLDFEGMRMTNTDTYLKEKGLYKASTYDNKAIEQAGAVPAVEDYYDAYSNLVELFLHFVKGTTLYDPLYDEEDEAYSFDGSGLTGYFNFVEWYYNNNHSQQGSPANGKNFSLYRGYDSPDFVKYSKKSDEGKALYNWLEACKIYFGVDGFGGFGENVFFNYNTFKVPTNAVLFRGLPTRKYVGEKIDKLTNMWHSIYHYSSQYGFIVTTLRNNLDDYGSSAAQSYCYGTNPDNMEGKSLVFQLIAAEYLYGVATNTESIADTWEALGELLENEVEPALYGVPEVVAAKVAKANEVAATYNEALKTYRAAIKDALRTRDAAVKAAEDTYKEGLKPIHDAFVAALTDYNFYMKMYNDLCGAYAIHAGSPFTGVNNPQAIIDYCLGMYEYWSDWASDLAGQIAEANIWLNGIQDETLDDLAEAYMAVMDILNGFESDQFADIEFWYEYWKAAYEAAIEYISSQE